MGHRNFLFLWFCSPMTIVSKHALASEYICRHAELISLGLQTHNHAEIIREYAMMLEDNHRYFWKVRNVFLMMINQGHFVGLDCISRLAAMSGHVRYPNIGSPEYTNANLHRNLDLILYKSSAPAFGMHSIAILSYLFLSNI